MKTLVAALFATTLVAAPAFADCGMKSAETETMTVAKAEVKAETAISTFDPAQTPVFEAVESDAEPINPEVIAAD